jgi:hypothetical protein
MGKSKKGKCPCKTHPTYLAVRKPKASCETCWKYYLELQTNKSIADNWKLLCIPDRCQWCHTASPIKNVCTCKHSPEEHNDLGCTVKVGSASCDDQYCDCQYKRRAYYDYLPANN